MKKNYTLLLLLLSCCFQLSAQTPCSQDNPAPVTNIIYTNPERDNPIVAFDLVVDAYTEFSLSSITVKMATANMAALNPTGDITVYSDDAGYPDAQLASETITPTVVTDAPIATFAIYTVTFTFATPVVLDNLTGDTEATFWVGFVMGNAVNGDTGVTGGDLVAGQPYAVINDTSGAWTLGTLDGTYTFEGECLLSVEDFGRDSISIHPNPSDDYVYINMTNPYDIEKVELFDITGKRVVNQSSSKIDLTNLKSGVYLMRLQTAQGSVTKKIVKN